MRISFHGSRTLSASNENLTDDEVVIRRRNAALARQKERDDANARLPLSQRGFATSYFLHGDRKYLVADLGGCIDSYTSNRMITFEKNWGFEILEVALAYFEIDLSRLTAKRRYV